MFDSDFTQWLLAAETPSIRYLTLRDLLHRPSSDADLQAAQHAIMTTGSVPEIFATQTPEGHWPNEHTCYSPKYRSTHWSMLTLAELAADPADERVQRGIEFMLSDTAGAVQRTLDDGKMRWFPCFWGNLLRYAVHARRTDDPRTLKIAQLLAQHAQTEAWSCTYNGDLPCAWGAARVLWGLAALPEAQRSPDVQDAITRGLEFLLADDHLLTGAYPTSGNPHKFWSQLNFPLFYQVDVLFVLRTLRDLNALDHPTAQAARDWLRAQRKPDGHWPGANPYSARAWKLGPRAETSRWISLHAALILSA